MMRHRLFGYVLTCVLILSLAGCTTETTSSPSPTSTPVMVPLATVTPSPTTCSHLVPCASWQDNNASVTQDLILTDHNGSPIWWCNNAGGCWVGNDKLGVTGASVFDLAVYLRVAPDGVHGEVVVDGQVLTAKDIKFLHSLEKAVR